MQRVTVATGDRAYPVVVGRGGLDEAGSIAAEIVAPTSAVVLTHPRLTGPFASRVLAGLERSGVRTRLIETPAGERYKGLATVARLYDRLTEAGVDRKSLLVTVGGGVIGDVGGFVAATYLRGIAFVQAPTTVLAQVDASIGGKTGVDLASGKNLVGAFHQPRAVIVDPAALASLPVREFRSGLAEVVKYGIICDADLFNDVADGIPVLMRRTGELLDAVIRRCCEIKADVVSQDETEQGLRAILNFGHTVGHAIEAETRYRRYKHGEAVSIGMVSACLIGEEMGLTPPDVTVALIDALRRTALPVGFPVDLSRGAVIDLLARDKKAIGGVPRFVLARAIGEVVVRGDVQRGAIESALARQAEIHG